MPKQDDNRTTVRVPLVTMVTSRDGSLSKDARLINVYVESIKEPFSEAKKSYLIKRPGLTEAYETAAGTARGTWFFNNAVWSAVGTKLYKNGSEVSGITFNSETTPIGGIELEEYQYYLFLCDGDDGWVVDTSDVVTQINVTYPVWQASTEYAVGDRVIPTAENGFFYEVTEVSGTAPYTSGVTQPSWFAVAESIVVDNELTWTAHSYGGFPSPHIPIPEYIDGYVFLIHPESADIYNSDVNNIFGWSPSNFKSAEIYPDALVALTKQNNQLLALGTETGEFFYDAEGISTPLGRVDSTVLTLGCAAPYALFKNERLTTFVGQSKSGGRAIWALEGFTPKKISDEYVEKALDREGASLSDATGYGIRTQGHLFYVLNLTSTTFVYDYEEQRWHEWQSDGSRFVGSFACDSLIGKAIVQHKSNGKLLYVDPSAYKDDTVDITCTFISPKYDFEIMARKFFFNTYIIGDQVDTTVTLSWSDDDYQTWSNGLVINMEDRGYTTSTGAARRRAFKIEHTDDTPLRLEAFEFIISSAIH